MRKMLATVAAIAAVMFLGFAGAVSAEEAKGTIQEVNVEERMITLEDGTSYSVGEGVAIEELEPGTEVTVSFEEQDGKMVANEVTPEG